MSDRNFSRRRRGGMRFRPSSGLNPNPNRTDRDATEARAEVVGEKPTQDKVFDRNRHAQEIERAENIAAGLPPEGMPAQQPPVEERGFREPHLDTPAEVHEEKAFEPVTVPNRPQGLVESI